MRSDTIHYMVVIVLLLVAAAIVFGFIDLSARIYD